MEKPRKLTTSQYVGLVRDLNSRMAQMPPLFDENHQLDEYKLVDSLANKAPRSHMAMLISQGFNPETGGFLAKTKDIISAAKSSASDEDSANERKKKLPKFKEREENSKKRHKKHSSLSLNFENKSHTTRECKFLKARNKDKDNNNYSTKDYKRKSRKMNLLEREDAHQRAKYLKYNKPNKAFAKKKTPKEETVVLYDTSDSNSS